MARGLDSSARDGGGAGLRRVCGGAGGRRSGRGARLCRSRRPAPAVCAGAAARLAGSTGHLTSGTRSTSPVRSRDGSLVLWLPADGCGRCYPSGRAHACSPAPMTVPATPSPTSPLPAPDHGGCSFGASTVYVLRLYGGRGVVSVRRDGPVRHFARITAPGSDRRDHVRRVGQLRAPPAGARSRTAPEPRSTRSTATATSTTITRDAPARRGRDRRWRVSAFGRFTRGSDRPRREVRADLRDHAPGPEHAGGALGPVRRRRTSGSRASRPGSGASERHYARARRGPPHPRQPASGRRRRCCGSAPRRWPAAGVRAFDMLVGHRGRGAPHRPQLRHRSLSRSRGRRRAGGRPHRGSPGGRASCARSAAVPPALRCRSRPGAPRRRPARRPPSRGPARSCRPRP